MAPGKQYTGIWGVRICHLGGGMIPWTNHTPAEHNQRKENAPHVASN